MAAPAQKLPGPDHPISIETSSDHVLVRLGSKVIVDTTRALILREGKYPPVYYIPRADVRMGYLTKTDHHTGCPYKGEASYFTIAAGGKVAENAVWTYETPYPSVEQIKEHLAFYPNRVDAIEMG